MILFVSLLSQSVLQVRIVVFTKQLKESENVLEHIQSSFGSNFLRILCLFTFEIL